MTVTVTASAAEVTAARTLVDLAQRLEQPVDPAMAAIAGATSSVDGQLYELRLSDEASDDLRASLAKFSADRTSPHNE